MMLGFRYRQAEVTVVAVVEGTSIWSWNMGMTIQRMRTPVAATWCSDAPERAFVGCARNNRYRADARLPDERTVIPCL